MRKRFSNAHANAPSTPPAGWIGAFSGPRPRGPLRDTPPRRRDVAAWHARRPRRSQRLHGAAKLASAAAPFLVGLAAVPWIPEQVPGVFVSGTCIAGSSRVSRRDLCHLLDVTGALEPILRARSKSRSPWLTVLTYHRIADDPEGQPFDPGVIDASPADFDLQIRTLKQYFTVIGIEELLEHRNGGRLPENPAIVTFDDGYRTCHDVALPVLQKHGVKATFFIATSYVTRRKLFWWDRISYAVRNARHEHVELRYPFTITLDIAREPERTLRYLLNLVKSFHSLDLERFVEELTAASGAPWDPDIERHFADQLVMSWDQVRALRRAGMEIHSHTRTHRILQTIDASDLASELGGAREDLEDQLNERVSSVSYPVGRPITQFPHIRDAVADAGYELGFSNCSGLTRVRGGYDPLDLRRISMEYHLPMSYFRGMLALPSLADAA